VSKMKLLLQTYSLHLAFGRHTDCIHYPKKLTMEECLAKAKKWGFAGVQLDPTHLLHGTREYGEQLKRTACELGLSLELGVCGFEPVQLRKKLLFAQSLGACFIRIFDQGPRPRDPNETKKRLDSIRQDVEAIIPDLERTKITLGWENHIDYDTSEQLMVLEEVNHERFRALFDVGNSMAFLEPPLETFRRLKKFIGGVHLKDYAMTGTTFGIKFYGTALGTGVIPLKEMLSVLRNETNLAHLVYEQCIEPKSSDPQESIGFEENTLLKSLRYAKEDLGLEIC